MRNLLLALSLGAAACGARAPRTTLPVQYSCGEGSGAPDLATTKLGWHDADGDHYVSWPQSPVDVSAFEFVVPADPRQDAIERVYDTSSGTSKADWRLIRREVCTARGGDSDVLARYVTGESLDKIAADFSLGSRDEARELVHHALLAVQRRYFRDR